MEPLDAQQQAKLLQRFPHIELSYETMSHKKVSTGSSNADYDTVLAIPYGKKAFLWCTFWYDRNVCFWMELGKDRKVVKMHVMSEFVGKPWCYGTVVYGTVCLCEGLEWFVVEDLLQCRGLMVHKLCWGSKLAFLREMLVADGLLARQIMWMPVMGDSCESIQVETIPYVIHHLQYRSLRGIVPYVNVLVDRRGTITTSPAAPCPLLLMPPPHRGAFHKQQYRLPTVFQLRADVQNDIYHLYAAASAREQLIYCGIANVPNFSTSVLLNSMFRKIRENDNLDAQEESEDEEDFQNCSSDKYVNLEKRIFMECVFHSTFRRWTPVRKSHEEMLVHVSKL